MTSASVRSIASVVRIFATLSLSGVVAAAPLSAAEARTLSWSESVKLTRESNADLKAAEAAFRSIEDLEGVARAGFLPTVNGVLDASRTGNSGSPDLTQTRGNQYSATFEASESVFNGLSDYANFSRAKANTRAAVAAYEIAKAKASYDLKSAFEGLFYAQNVRILTTDIVKRRLSNLELVQLRFESGRENKGSVLLSRANLNQAKYESLQSEDNQAIARATLARVIGLDDTDETLAVVDEVPTNPAPPKPPDFRRLAAITPDHVQAAAQEDSAQAAVTVARSTYFPSLGVSANYGRRDVAFFPNGPDRWTLDATITIPLFHGGKDFYSTKSATATYTGSIGNRVSVDRGLLVKLRQAFHGYVEAVMKSEVDVSFRDAAQLRAEIARTQYNNGLVSFNDWDIIENDLIARQKTSLQSLRDRVTGEAIWEQAQGAGVVP